MTVIAFPVIVVAWIACGMLITIIAVGVGGFLLGVRTERKRLASLPADCADNVGPEVRRDVEPDRGNVILGLGILSVVLGALGLLSVVALPIGFIACIMARIELKRIGDGQVDPRGARMVRWGRTFGLSGVGMSLGWAAIFFAIAS
jgi:hypothetical protein